MSPNYVMPQLRLAGQRSRRWLTALCFGAGLAGCAAPLPKLAPSLPSHWRNEVGTEKAAPVDLQHWWHVFSDPELDRIVERALHDNLDLAALRERLLAERTLHAREGFRYFPQLTARTDDAIDPDASASYFVAGFDARWELGLFGRSEGTRRESAAQVAATEADVAALRVSLVAEVVREWVELRSSQEKLQLQRQLCALGHEQWRLLRVRQRLGLETADRVDLSRAEWQRMTANLSDPRHAIETHLARLAMLVGQPAPEPDWRVSGVLPTLADWGLTEAPVDLLRYRPEIAHAEAEVVRAAGALDLSRAELYPHLSLGAASVFATNISREVPRVTTPNTILSLGPSISIPLFDWGMRKAAVKADGFRLKASVLDYRQAVLQAIADVEIALNRLQQEAARERHLQAGVEAIQRSVDREQRRIGLRLGNPLTLNDRRLEVLKAQLELVDVRAARSVAFVALYKALGGAPLPSPDNPAPRDTTLHAGSQGAGDR